MTNMTNIESYDILRKARPNGDIEITHITENGREWMWNHWGLGARVVLVRAHNVEEFERVAGNEGITFGDGITFN